MAKAPYFKADGKKGRARALPDELFGGSVNRDVLHRVVQAQLANRRQGTGAGKNRARVRGGSRKPWRQKGTGRARQGTIRAPQWVGGGRAFPPQPHSWRQRLPKKMRAIGRQSALSARAADDRVILIDALDLEKPQTGALVRFLAGIGVEGKVLLLSHGLRRNLALSARNVAEVIVRPFGEESTYDILWARTVVIERGAIDAFGKNGSAASKAPVASDAAEEPAPASDGVVDTNAVELSGPGEGVEPEEADDA